MAAWSLVMISLLLFSSSDHAVSFDRSKPTCAPPQLPLAPNAVALYPLDVDLLQFAWNLEHLECDFFLIGALGCGLDCFLPELAFGGPPSFGGMRANLDETTRRIIEEFGYQEVGHLRAINSTIGGIPRPLMDLSMANFAKIMDDAFGYRLNPPFDPYLSSIHYLLASYLIPYMGLVGYVGANPLINGYAVRRLLAGLLGVESGQDAVIRALLYEHQDEYVPPYRITVAEFTDRISELRNRLAACGGIKDEGLVVPPAELGAEGRVSSNIISANSESLSYDRTPAEILRVVYGTGDEHQPGGFFPKGGNGKIAREYIRVY